MNFENNLDIGCGIYTMPEVSRILRIPNSKVNRWVNNFWDGVLATEFDSQYSWRIENSKAISFHTLVEMYSFYQLTNAGVKPQRIIEAHNILATQFNTPFPFAHEGIMSKLKTDGKVIYFKTDNEAIYSLDIKRQYSLEFIQLFFKKLDFNEESIASRLWPLGKAKSILCDPRKKFGLPTIDNTNIYPETLYQMYKAGDSEIFLANLYQLTLKQVNNAIEFCTKAA